MTRKIEKIEVEKYPTLGIDMLILKADPETTAEVLTFIASINARIQSVTVENDKRV